MCPVVNIEQMLVGRLKNLGFLDTMHSRSIKRGFWRQWWCGHSGKFIVMNLVTNLAGPHLTVGGTDTIAQSRPTSLVSGGRAFWAASIAQAERDTRATHVHSNTGA